MDKTLQLPFLPGDEVYATSVDRQWASIDCAFCAKAGSVTGLDGSVMVCPRCSGSKEVGTIRETWKVGLFPERVTRVFLVLAEGHPPEWTLTLGVLPPGRTWNAGRCFPSREEALLACDKLNAAGAVKP